MAKLRFHALAFIAAQKTTVVKLTQGRGAAIHSGKDSGEARVTRDWKLEDLE